MLLDHSWLRVTETTESKTVDKGGLLHPLYNAKSMIVLPPKEKQRSLSQPRIKASWYHFSKTLITLSSYINQKEYTHILKTCSERKLLTFNYGSMNIIKFW